MKAYEIGTEDMDGVYWSRIVWAETAGNAKYQGMDDEEIGAPDDFIKIRCHRKPWADKYYHSNISYDELMLKRIEHGMTLYADPTDYGDITTKADVPLIRKVGGLNMFFGMYQNGQIYFSERIGRFVEIKEADDEQKN